MKELIELLQAPEVDQDAEIFADDSGLCEAPVTGILLEDIGVIICTDEED